MVGLLTVFHSGVATKPWEPGRGLGFGLLRRGSLEGMRLLTTGLLPALISVSVLAGCAGDEPDPEPVRAAQLPENLCAAVPETVVSRWSLVEERHATDETDDRAEATCSMTGEAEGAPVTLELSLTSWGASDKAASRQLMDDDLAERCADLESVAGATFTDEDNRCSSQTPAEPVAARGQATEHSLSVPAHGVATVTMRHSGELWQLVPADVVAVSGTLTTTDPAELG